MFQHRS